MPLYSFRAIDTKKACDYCRDGFELLLPINAAYPEKCPKCGCRIERVITGTFGLSKGKTDLDRRAKEQGFHKLKKVDKGKYEKIY